MLDKKFNIFNNGFQTFTRAVKHTDIDTDTELTEIIYTDKDYNVDLIVRQFDSGRVEIIPQNSNATIEIYDNQIDIKNT